MQPTLPRNWQGLLFAEIILSKHMIDSLQIKNKRKEQHDAN